MAQRFYFGARNVSRPLVRLLWNPRVSGLENIPRDGGFVIASNHLANIDSFVLPVALPRQIRFVAKDTLWTQNGLRGRILRWFFDGCARRLKRLSTFWTDDRICRDVLIANRTSYRCGRRLGGIFIQPLATMLAFFRNGQYFASSMRANLHLCHIELVKESR